MNIFWRRLIALIIKELQAIVRNPKTRNLIVGPVFVQLAVFPFAATLEVKNATLGILNRDNGPASVEIIQRLGHSSAFSHLVMLHGEAELENLIDTQGALLALHFPDDFSRKLATGNDAHLQVIADGRHSNSGQIAAGYVQSVVRDYTEELNIAHGYHALSRLSIRNLYNPNLNFRWFILPSLIGMITTLSVMFFTSLAVAREREQGTFEQLLVTPLTTGMIMLGKAVPAILVALLQGILIFLAAVFIYGVPFGGSLLLLGLGMLAYSLALTGFGFFIAAICSTQQQAFLGVFFFMMPTVVLSGFVAPVENMPVFLQHLSLADPLRHFIVLLKGVFLKNFTPAMCWEHLWPLLVISVVMNWITYRIFKRSLF